jgi:hypothetical protein
MESDRLNLLLQRHFDDVLTADERAELSQLLLESPRARDAFWELAQTNAVLREWGKQSWGESPELLPAQPQRVRTIWLRLGLGAAALAVAGFFATQHFRKTLPSLDSAGSGEFATTDNDDPTPDGVAVLTKSTDVVWVNDAKPIATGSVLAPGWLKFKSGAIQLEFSRGARIVLEGPAELNLISNNEAFLQTGRMRANVPEPAHGFKITSREFALVDHGTEFGCMVTADGRSEVHVFTGEVAVQPAARADSLRSLHRAEAVSVNPQELTTIVSRPDLFLSEEGLSRRETDRTAKELAAWKDASRALARTPGALLHLDFEHHGDWERTLLNRVHHEEEAFGASIVGASWADGRWPGKGALEFKSTGDRIRLNLPGRFESITLMTWARVDELQHKQHALLMGESLTPGELHWYVYKDGSLGLGVRVGNDPTTNEGQWRNYHSRTVIPRAMPSAWLFLASTFDGTTGCISHYVNGEAVGQSPAGTHPPLILDDCEIGNWGINLKDPKWKTVRGLDTARRNFRGAMDEFTILDHLLDESEIRRLYELGRPQDSSPGK